MYVLGRVTQQSPGLAGSEVAITDERNLVVRTPDGRAAVLTRDQARALVSSGAVAWDDPGMQQKLLAFLDDQARAEREKAVREAAEAEERGRIEAEGELDGLRLLKRGRGILTTVLAVLLLAAAGLIAWGVLQPDPPVKRAAKPVAAGTLLMPAAPSSDEGPYVAAAEIPSSGDAYSRITGYFTGTETPVKGVSVPIRENLLVSPQVSAVPLHLRPLAVPSSGYFQRPVSVDQSSGRFAVYADNASAADPNLYNLRFLETTTMRSRELVAGEEIIANRSREDHDTPEYWDTVGGYAIDDSRVLLQALYDNANPSKRSSRLLWYNTVGLGSDFGAELPAVVEVNAADLSFKDTPRVSTDPAGKGHWVAYLSHADADDRTSDGRLVIVHSFSDTDLSAPATSSVIYADQLLGRGTPGVQSSPQLLGDRVLFVDSGKTYIADLGSISAAAGSGAVSVKLTTVPVAGELPPQLLRDYKGKYWAIVTDKDQRIAAYPEGGGEPIVLSGSAARKLSVQAFRSRVVWLEKGDSGIALREAAVMKVSETLLPR